VNTNGVLLVVEAVVVVSRVVELLLELLLDVDGVVVVAVVSLVVDEDDADEDDVLGVVGVVVVVVTGRIVDEDDDVLGVVGAGVVVVVVVVVMGLTVDEEDVDEEEELAEVTGSLVEDEVEGVLGVVVGLVVVGKMVVCGKMVGSVVTSSTVTQLLGLATKPLMRPTNRMHPKPPAMPAMKTGLDKTRAFPAVLAAIIYFCFFFQFLCF
jgi:hypothetical protein